MTLKASTAVRDAMTTALITAFGNSGLLRLYSGTRPANPAAAITGTLLATLTMNATVGTSANGVFTANAITSDSAADATATATHFRLWKSDGTTACLDGDVGIGGSGADMILNTTNIVTGATVAITEFVLTDGNA